jgi:hypothetical protein
MPEFGVIGMHVVLRALQLQTLTRVTVNRTIYNIIARDLSLVGSGYIDWMIPTPESCAVVISYSMGNAAYRCL